MAVENVLAREALEAVAQIEREADQKKLAQLDSLVQARRAITERLEQLQHQIVQIDSAVEMVTGRSPTAAAKRRRRDLTEVRERVGRWMEARRGQKFSAGNLIREFPELEGTVVSVFIKPLIHGGNVKTDISEGMRRQKYYVA